MGYTLGTIRYIIKAPIAQPINFFKYGGFFYAVLRAIQAGPPNLIFNTLSDVVPVLLTYIFTRYLPPTSATDVLIPIVLGAVVAGLKWRANV